MHWLYTWCPCVPLTHTKNKSQTIHLIFINKHPMELSILHTFLQYIKARLSERGSLLPRSSIGHKSCSCRECCPFQSPKSLQIFRPCIGVKYVLDSEITSFYFFKKIITLRRVLFPLTIDVSGSFWNLGKRQDLHAIPPSTHCIHNRPLSKLSSPS